MCEEYRKAVDKLFELRADEIIPNGKPEHAAILLGTIFKYAKDHVYLFCKNLKAEVFDHEFLSTQIRDACQRNVIVQILLSNGRIESKTMEKIRADFPCVTLKHFTGKLSPETHFAVSDGCAFRMERDHEKIQAWGCANRPDIALQLEKLFDEMKGFSADLIQYSGE